METCFRLASILPRGGEGGRQHNTVTFPQPCTPAWLLPTYPTTVLRQSWPFLTPDPSCHRMRDLLTRLVDALSRLLGAGHLSLF